MQDPMTNNFIDNFSKLQWACRRGMLELDVLLGNFLNHAYSNLEIGDKILFVELLNCTDPELFSWLLGHEQPPEPRFIRLIEMIRQAAISVDAFNG